PPHQLPVRYASSVPLDGRVDGVAHDAQRVFTPGSPPDPRHDVAAEVLDGLQVGRVAKIPDEQHAAALLQRQRGKLQLFRIGDHSGQFAGPDEVVDEVGFLLRDGQDGIGASVDV